MATLLFYLVIVLILAAFVSLFIYKRKYGKKNKIRMKRRLPSIDFGALSSDNSKKSEEEIQVFDETKQSPYDPNLIVLQLNAFPGKPYMGYELHQALLSSGLRLDEKNIFHRHDDANKGNIVFSLAAATPTGVFSVEDMGAFKCGGLLIFMHLDAKQKLMPNFDLMLDTARQLTEELGGDIYDDVQQQLSADVIKRIRERICSVQTNNLYTADLLDNLD